MTGVESGKSRRSCRSKSCCCIFWLTGPFCRLSHAILLFSLCFFMTLPRTSREQEMTIQNDLAIPTSSESDESNNQLMDNTLTSVITPQTPETVTVGSPPSLRQPHPSVRSRTTAKNKGGGDHQHNHQQQPKFSAETSVIVTTPLGKIQGRSYYINKTGEWVGGFLGVPYAQPPVHRLRFRPPMPLQSLTKDENDILNATDFGAICIQPAEQKIWDVLYLKNNRVNVRKRKLDNYNMSEDCLTLNIYVPL
ncbi:Cholinesterase, partial [Orchesella cincta]